MIVCSCNVLSDHVVRRAVDDADVAVARVSCLFDRLGCRPQCGRCAATLKRIIREGTAEGADTCPAVLDDLALCAAE